MDPTPPRLLVGTSGYAYAEWTEAGFYPPGTRSGHMLAAYADRFPVTELNFTWYQMPRAEAMERMEAQVPEGFRFAAKLTRTLTHEVDPEGWRGQADRYREGIAPLIQAGRLRAVLVQLPPCFRRTPDNRRYLAALLDALDGLPLAVEFRHASWAADRVFEELTQRKVALAAIDRPDLPGLFPTLDVVTCPDFFYVRFHGRNAKGWRSGNMQQQFDYLYNEAELQEWIDRRIDPMARQARTGLLFFNNHVGAQAARNARQLTLMLAQRGLAEKSPADG
jgi:uncharacterized protein YecE (DUF72 family)